jgi:hypothetical protein
MGSFFTVGQSRNNTNNRGEKIYLKACNPIKLLDLPPRSNVISSHHCFSIKKTLDGNIELKSRMVPHGNRDREKSGLRTDSTTAQFA